MSQGSTMVTDNQRVQAFDKLWCDLAGAQGKMVGCYRIAIPQEVICSTKPAKTLQILAEEAPVFEFLICKVDTGDYFSDLLDHIARESGRIVDPAPFDHYAKLAAFVAMRRHLGFHRGVHEPVCPDYMLKPGQPRRYTTTFTLRFVSKSPSSQAVLTDFVKDAAIIAR